MKNAQLSSLRGYYNNQATIQVHQVAVHVHWLHVGSGPYLGHSVVFFDLSPFCEQSHEPIPVAISKRRIIWIPGHSWPSFPSILPIEHLPLPRCSSMHPNTGLNQTSNRKLTTKHDQMRPPDHPADPNNATKKGIHSGRTLHVVWHKCGETPVRGCGLTSVTSVILWPAASAYTRNGFWLLCNCPKRSWSYNKVVNGEGSRGRIHAHLPE